MHNPARGSPDFIAVGLLPGRKGAFGRLSLKSIYGSGVPAAIFLTLNPEPWMPEIKTLCRFNGLYSVCEGKNWEDQHAACDFSEKSPYRNKCLYNCFNGRCDNPDAQAHARANYNY